MSVGLDIGSKTIKVIELSKERGRFSLLASGIFAHRSKTPESFKEDKEFVDLAQGIKKLFREAKISSKEVAISLPETQVYTRTVKYPLLTDEEVASAVKWEAEQYIPIPVAEAIVQHKIIERREDTTPPQVSVLLIAAPRALVEKYARVVEMAGLYLDAVETDLLALVRALAPTNSTALLLDFGARSTDIAIARRGQLIFSRSIPTSGDAFTRALSQTLGIEELQAEEYKRTYGLNPNQLEGKIKTSLEPLLGLVSDEIRKAIHFYASEEKGDTPNQVILSGGSSGMPALASSLTKLLNLEVVIGNPFSKIELEPEVARSLAGYAHFYGIAVGLAMREG